MALRSKVSLFDQALAALSARAPPVFSMTLRTHDYLWDMRHGVETRQHVARLTAEGSPYEPINPRRLANLLDRVPQRIEAATFIDVGSGKGRALLVAARRPFGRVCGIEYAPDLHRIATQNLVRYRGALRCASVSAIECDARSYEWPLTPLVVLFFNPFTEATMSAVVETLKASVAAHPRPVTILCYGQYTVRRPLEQWPSIQCLWSTRAAALYHQA